MSKRQQNSSKRNKHKSHQSVSITDKSIFTRDLLLDQEDNNNPVQGVSSSTSASSSQLHQRKLARANAECLEDIDQDDNKDDEEEEDDRNNRHIVKPKPKKHSLSTIRTPAATEAARDVLSRPTSLALWMNTTREQEAVDLWSWVTSSRTISQEQRRQEDREDTLGLARHQMGLQTRLSITFDSTKQRPGAEMDQNQKNDKKKVDVKDGGAGMTEREKENAKTLWDSSKMATAFDLKRQDWVALSALTVATLGVRFWRISWPDEVILDETNVGQLVNGYTKGEFVLDAHPPLGKMILAGVSSFSNYSGAFDFEDIGDQYTGSVPYVSMRATMALMGALCAPMAYVTLKASGHGAPAAIFATTFVAFDNALTANNRMMALDASLMFFTAATVMSWKLFIKQSARPFTVFWWMWLLATGMAMAGAMSVKLIGIVSAVTTLYVMSLNLWTLARDKTVNTSTWLKHCAARMGALLALPITLYLIIFQIHFANETRQPDYRTSPRAESDLDQLSRLYRHSLISHYPTDDHIQTWRDVVYGSVVQIQSEAKPHAGSVGNVYIHSSAEANPKGSQQQLVSGYSYPDINTQWIIIKAEVDSDNDEPEEIPSRLELVKNGDLVRVRHVSTRKCLHSHNVRTYTNAENTKLNEVSGYGGPGFDGDSNDWWVIETVDSETLREGTKDASEPIRALESTFRMKHYEIGCYLFASDSPLPEPWGAGRTEVICRSDARVTDKSVWRFAHNRHDYLPKDTPKTSYPTPSFWAKFTEMHQLMWSYQGPLEENLQISSSNPRQWPMGQAMILAWSGYQRQIAIVANPVVWWTSALGLAIYIFSMVVFAVRQKRGYFETGRLREFQRFHLSDAGTFFTGWALHYLPFFFVDRVLYMHHYFPSLYFSILLTSSILPGLSGFLSRPVRFALLTFALLLTIVTFLRLAPLSYGSEMSREKCEAVGTLVSPRRRRGGGYFNNELDCSLAPLMTDRPKLLSLMRRQAIAEKALSKRQRQEVKTIDGQGRPLPTKNADSAAVTTTAAAANHFMTTEPVLPGDTAASSSTPGNGVPLLSGTNSGKTNRLSVTKPLPKIRAPVLPMHLPPFKRPLPVPDIVLLPYQRPPQLWDRETQAQMMQREDLNLYEKLQIQQLVSGNYLKVNNGEDGVLSDEKEGEEMKKVIEEQRVMKNEDGSNQEQQQQHNQAQDRNRDGRKDAFVEQQQQYDQLRPPQQQQNEKVSGANDNNQPPSPVLPAAEHLHQENANADSDAEIDRVLSRFQERNLQANVLAAAAYHQIHIPTEQLQVEDDGVDSNVNNNYNVAIDRINRRLADDNVAGNVNDTDGGNNRDQQQRNHNTMGVVQPIKFEGKSFKRRQKMMEAAVAVVKKQEELLRENGSDQERGGEVFGGLPEKLFPVRKTAEKEHQLHLQQREKLALEQKLRQEVRQERKRLAREDRIEKRFQQRKEAQRVCGAGMRNAVEIRRQVEEEDDAAVVIGFYDDGDEEDDLKGKGDYVQEMVRQIKAEHEVRKRMTREEKEVLKKEREMRRLKQQEVKEARERAVAERKRIRLLVQAEAEAAAAAAEEEEEEEGTEYEEDEDDSAEGAEVLPPPTSEGEGYQLLQQQQDDAYYGRNDEYDYDKGDDAEDQEFEMRGPPISVDSPEELKRVLKQLQEEGVRAEVVRGAVTETIEAVVPAAAAAAVGSEEDELPPPPISVKNAEELASVLEKLAADGVRAEVVQGDLTRYVEPPPMASV
ncbi:MAG: Dolichyl-phosphate-mannose-protein mannosyltransferase-domain-containing protein [Linnemannia gamsii]|nr:MAG: Dolichyl-phosphate-mannose-protein mannosyltransferase-domain-containing protein [Linnemannia gamsii]